MKKLVKWFLTAVTVALVMRPGLEAAPSRAAVEKARTFPSKVTHIDDLKFPGFDVHVHPYPTTTTQAPIHVDFLHELLGYLETTFHFVQVVDKNELLATDLVDQWSDWYKYLTQLMPFFKKINASDIENPQHDAPGSILDNMWQSVLKENSVTEVDKTDLNGDGEIENSNIHVQYTTVKFDPVGKLAEKLWNTVTEFAFFDHLKRWFLRVIKDMVNFAVFNPDHLTINTTDAEEKDDVGVGIGIGGVILPEGVLHLSHYDPVTFGINTILFIIYNVIFWQIYYPNSGIENLFADYPDIVPECLEGEECPEAECPEGEECPAAECPEGEECPAAECPEGEECPAEEEAADGEEAEEGDAAAVEGEAADGDGAGEAPPEGGDAEGDGGDDGETNRNDDFYYYDYDYQDQFINRQGVSSYSRFYGQESNKGGLSSNYYSHGDIPPHQAYTLQDTNIYEKKKK